MSYLNPHNPYVPGDPFSYDLKWIVAKVKEILQQLETLDEAIDQKIFEGFLEHSVVQFKTVADMLAADIKDGSIVLTLGYYEEGDRGSLFYLVKDFNPGQCSLNYFLTLDNNQQIAIPVVVTPYVTPEMFGAKSDASADASAAFNIAIETGRPVDASGAYLISGDVVVGSDAVLYLNQSQLTFDTSFKSIRIHDAENVRIYGGHLIASVDELNHKAVDIDSCNNVVISGMTVEDFGGDGFCLASSTNVIIEDCTAKNNLINFFAMECYEVAWNNIRSYGGKFKYNVQFKSCQKCTIDEAYVEDVRDG